MARHHWLIGILLVWLSGFSGSLAAQTAPTAFVKGLELINSNAPEAKTQLLIAQQEDPAFHGTYHFLGVLYLDENKQTRFGGSVFQPSHYVESYQRQ